MVDGYKNTKRNQNGNSNSKSNEVISPPCEQTTTDTSAAPSKPHTQQTLNPYYNGNINDNDNYNDNLDNNNNNNEKNTIKPHRMSKELKRRRSSLSEVIKPETPTGWITLISALSTAILAYEIRLQKRLTCPPLVFTTQSQYTNKDDTNHTHPMKSILDKLTIFQKPIQPSLFVGTRSILASAAAYALHGPHHHERFREIITVHSDGATIALDWELPTNYYDTSLSSIHVRKTSQQHQENIFNGPIDKPVVLILHGINNDSGFGYIRSLMRSCTDRGWIACGMNFRGCGGIPLSTPRGYNAAYTGDLRYVIQCISSRFKKDSNIPLFLVGNSLGANVMTKYLGEEGFANTLPKCIAGAVSLGNPLRIHSQNVPFPWGEILAAGVKKTLLLNLNTFSKMTCFHFQHAFRKALLSRTIGQLDDVSAPFFIRNNTEYPFETKIGYTNGEEYWDDASSNQYIQHVSVPLLKLSSQDDFLVTHPASQSLSKCLVNPNITVVKTKCGGHLGWQEASPDGSFGIGKSWADTAMADFIAAVIEVKSLKSHDHEEMIVNPSIPLRSKL